MAFDIYAAFRELRRAYARERMRKRGEQMARDVRDSTWQHHNLPRLRDDWAPGEAPFEWPKESQ